MSTGAWVAIHKYLSSKYEYKYFEANGKISQNNYLSQLLISILYHFDG